MTRIKKSRGAGNRLIFDDSFTPKSERLADPDSYESRKKKANEKKKRHRSVYQKAVDEAKEQKKAGKKGKADDNRQLGPLAEKIRRMNAQKAAQEKAKEATKKADSSES
ncbi:MAG: hypothetical protein ACPGPF_06925 [Pontibacterium sp.]